MDLKRKKQIGKFYLSLPEMRVFWVLLVLLAIIGVISALYIGPAPLKLMVLVALFVVAVMFLAVMLKLAKTSLEVQLERSQLKTIISDLQDGIIAYDPNFRVVIFNKSAENIFDLKASQVIGKSFSPDVVREQEYKFLVQVLFPVLAPTVHRRTSTDAYPQESLLSFDDPEMEIHVVTSRITDPNGKLLGFFKSVHDATRERALLKSKSEFITVAAHQLRTPLAAINWIFQGLSSGSFGKVDESLDEVVSTGAKAANKLSKTVDDLLNVSKIEEGRYGYHFENVDLVELIENVIEPYMPIASEHNVKLYFDYKPINVLSSMRVDPSKVSIILQNLIENAIKYNVEDGSVTVRIDKLPDEPFIQISVKDSGVGVPEEDRDKLFTKFFRAENVVKFETDGTGLGLYIVKNIVRRHGGKIWAESELNRGTTFYFTLPVDPSLIPKREITLEEYF